MYFLIATAKELTIKDDYISRFEILYGLKRLDLPA